MGGRLRAAGPMRDLTRTDHARPATARPKPVGFDELVTGLRALGVEDARSVLVHASLSKIGWVEGGAATVAEALRDVLGDHGTIVVPTATSDNSDTSATHLRRTEGLSPGELSDYRARMPAFDPARTPSTGMGALAEHIRTRKGAVRSAHPQTSFAAVGARAAAFTEGHAEDCHLGESSPLARLYDEHAHILLHGVGWDVCTALHLAEFRYTATPPTSTYNCVVRRDGRPAWWAYEDVVLDDGDFAELGRALDATPYVTRSPLGSANARIIALRQAVDFAAGWMAATRKS